MGVQLALALRRRATAARPAAACPPAAGRPAGRVRRPAAVRAHRRAAGGGGGDRRRSRRRAPDEPAGAGRRRRGQDGRGAAGDAAGRRRRAGRPRCSRPPRCSPPSTPARCARCSGRSAQAGELGAAEHATRVTLLTGSLGAKAKRQALLDAQSGEAGIVVGTHALIQDRVGFAELGLVVVDEQHRFGVEQRDALRGRGEHTVPHMLVMTATPIPRTVAMTVYGDLEVSALRELPAGRSPIATTVVPLAEQPSWFEPVWRRVREEVAAGHQAYVVCPRVGEIRSWPRRPTARSRPDDEEESEARRPPLAVLDVGPKLAEGALAGLRLGMLHGKLPADEKDAVMRAFERGELDVLVATTVIEVGVDVPNATAMVILDADRFGLSQLHQLRGRVGRGVGGRGVPAGHRDARGHRRPRPARRDRRHHRRLRAGPAGPRAAPGGRRARRRCSPAAARGCGCSPCSSTRRSSPRRGCTRWTSSSTTPPSASTAACRARRPDGGRRGARGLARPGLNAAPRPP